MGGRDKRELVPEHHVLMALEGHLSKAGVVSCFIPPYMQYVRRRNEEVFAKAAGADRSRISPIPERGARMDW